MHLAEIITSVIHEAGNLDVSGEDWLSTPGNVAIVLPNDDIALFDDNEDEQGVYQGHLLFKSRGREAIESAKECFRRMFCDHGAEVIYGLIPPDRRDGKSLYEKVCMSIGRAGFFRRASTVVLHQPARSP